MTDELIKRAEEIYKWLWDNGIKYMDSPLTESEKALIRDVLTAQEALKQTNPKATGIEEVQNRYNYTSKAEMLPNGELRKGNAILKALKELELTWRRIQRNRQKELFKNAAPYLAAARDVAKLAPQITRVIQKALPPTAGIDVVSKPTPEA